MLNLTQLLSITKLTYPHLCFNPKGPLVVVWNLIKSCNLNCLFCYYDAKEKFKPEAIDYTLAQQIVKQLKQAKIRYLILSGGEPLLYPRILDLLEDLSLSDIRVGISTNGTLINKELALALKAKGLDYIGISLDGLKDTHNFLRNSSVSFKQALAGLEQAKAAGIKTGIRLVLNAYNYKYIKDIFSLAKDLKVERLCFYHLVYSGRARVTNYDLSRKERRYAINLIIEYSKDWIKRKIPTEVLTVDNFSDSVILLNHIRKINPEHYPLVLEFLKRKGGCPAGKKILSIDHLGFMHPCQFWKQTKLADLSKDNLLDILNVDTRKSNADTRRLNLRPSACNPRESALLKGRCAICKYQDLCGGCRIRAYNKYKDFWQEDPACCLSDAEIRDETDILECN